MGTAQKKKKTLKRKAENFAFLKDAAGYKQLWISSSSSVLWRKLKLWLYHAELAWDGISLLSTNYEN